MTAVGKLAGLSVVLAGAFGGAALAGRAVGPVHDPVKAVAPESPDGMGMGAGHGKGAALATEPVRGLAVSANGLTLKLARTTAAPGNRFTLRFRIVGRDGQTGRDFEVEHTKRMHLIVARRDMTGSSDPAATPAEPAPHVVAASAVEGRLP